MGCAEPDMQSSLSLEATKQFHADRRGDFVNTR